MKIIKKIKSWNSISKKDCFGYGIPDDIDHIYPISLGGSNSKINKQRLSVKANAQKKNKTKGKIDQEWRFAILKQTKNDITYGIMFIRKKDWPIDHWYQVIPSK